MHPSATEPVHDLFRKTMTCYNENQHLYKEVCVQPRTSAVNKTLPAFAAECHAAMSLLLSADTHNCRSISPPAWHSAAKPLRNSAVDRWDRQTDGWIDYWSFHRPCSAKHPGSVDNTMYIVVMTLWQDNVIRVNHMLCRCSLLLDVACFVVCVGHTREPCKNG